MIPCALCGLESDTTADFCEGCGGPLEASCPNCSFDNPPGFHFCGRCGSPLGALSEEVPFEPSLKSDDGQAERRQLTVMFCDLVGSTALSTRLEPEELRELLRNYQEVCNRVISRYGGHVAQYLGDGILAYFGFPKAHEDDARRAVHAGLEILGSMSEVQSNAVEATAGKVEQISVRIGIDTGEVVAGEVGAGGKRERLALGQTPNIAARLQGEAVPDTVLISEATHLLVAGHFVTRNLGSVELKGVEEPVEVFRALAANERGAVETRSNRGLTPLVGRQAICRRLTRVVEKARAGKGQIVVVSGEAGIGKSRLVKELQNIFLAADGEWWVGRCVSYLHRSAFHAINDLLEQLAEFERSNTVEAKVRKLERMLEQQNLDLNTAMPLLLPLLNLPPEERYPPPTLTPPRRKEKTITLLADFFFRLAESRSMALVVEDLHWSDPSSMQVIEYLLPLVADRSLMLVLTHRSSVNFSWSLPPGTVTIQPGRLNDEESAEVIHYLTDHRALPEEVLDEILRKTDGIPIFVEELTKMVLESGLLEEGEKRFELRGPLPPLAIPPTLQDSLMARLDNLSEGKQIAQQGSVLGKEFSYELLQAVFPAHHLALRRGLRQLVDAELLETASTDDSMYSFRHALIQDAAYRSLLKSTRSQYHQQIAFVLAARFPEIGQNRPEIIARHYTEAGLADLAIGYWQQAGQKSVERSAHLEATGHLQKGLELLHQLPQTALRDDRELGLQATLGAAASAVRGFAAPEVEEAYQRAFALGQKVGDAPELFWIYWGLWAFNIMRSNLDEALEIARRLENLATAKRDMALLMEARFTIGSTHFVRGELTPARAALEEGLLLDTADRDRSNTFITGQDVGVTSRAYLAMTWWHLGYPDRALTQSREAVAEARRIEHPFSLISALACAACVHQYRGEPEGVRRNAQEAVDMAEQLGFFWVSQGRLMLGWSLASDATVQEMETEERQRHLKEALELMWESYEALSESGSRLTQPYCQSMLADAHLRNQNPVEGLKSVAAAEEIMQATGERLPEASLLHLRAELLLQLTENASDNATQAEECYQSAIEVARHQRAKVLQLRASVGLARLWRERQPGEARQMLKEIFDAFTEGFETKDLQAAAVLLNELGDA